MEGCLKRGRGGIRTGNVIEAGVTLFGKPSRKEGEGRSMAVK